jgi:hypothetical protein
MVAGIKLIQNGRFYQTKYQYGWLPNGIDHVLYILYNNRWQRGSVDQPRIVI